MLHIKRREHEQIFIGDEVVITVIKGRTIIGVDAPDHIRIRRGKEGAPPPKTEEPKEEQA